MTIETTHNISEADFLEAQKVWCAREIKKLPGRALLFILSIVFGGFLGLTFKYLPNWLTVGLGISLLSIWAAGQWRRKAVHRYQYRLKADHMSALHIWIHEAGYRSEQDGLCGGWISWKHFTGWCETPRIFVLGMGLTFITVPKANLPGEQQQSLQTLLKTNLGKSR